MKIRKIKIRKWQIMSKKREIRKLLNQKDATTKRIRTRKIWDNETQRCEEYRDEIRNDVCKKVIREHWDKKKIVEYIGAKVQARCLLILEGRRRCAALLSIYFRRIDYYPPEPLKRTRLSFPVTDKPSPSKISLAISVSPPVDGKPRKKKRLESHFLFMKRKFMNYRRKHR